MQRTKHGQDGASPLISVFCGREQEPNMNRVWHRCALSGAMALACIACGVGKDGSCGIFASEAAGAQVAISTVQRVPAAWGGEQYVFAQLRAGTYESPMLEIDINGRFCEELHVDISRDRQWARVYLDLVPPWIGESVPIDGGKGGYWFKSYARGETAKQERFPYTVVAYVDFKANTVLRHSSATHEERGAILGLARAVPVIQEIRQHRIEWLAASRK
jgi:hypothetical protein